MNTKGRGVALSLQEQTDSWRGCGAQWRQEEGKKQKTDEDEEEESVQCSGLND